MLFRILASSIGFNFFIRLAWFDQLNTDLSSDRIPAQISLPTPPQRFLDCTWN